MNPARTGLLPLMDSTLAIRIVENLSTAVFLFDRDLRLLTLNPAGEALLETSAKQARHQHACQLFPESGLLLQTLQRALEESHPITEHSLRLNLSGNRQISVDCCLNPVNEAHRVHGLLLEMIRVDKHLRLNRDENLLLQQQVARNVIRGLAHEIKNPLGGLRGAAQLLARELADPGLCEYTEIIVGEADRLQTLLNRLLGPRALPHRNPINIHRVLFRMHRLLLSEVGEGLEIVNDFDPSIPDFLADPDQLFQAVLNIARNAAQAMNGKGRLILRTRVQRKTTLNNRQYKLALKLEIIDNGPGIPGDIQEQIFYPLVTGRPGGSGLGLSIAQTLINQHGGLISCLSQPGETIFTLWLPMEFESNE